MSEVVVRCSSEKMEVKDGASSFFLLLFFPNEIKILMTGMESGQGHLIQLLSWTLDTGHTDCGEMHRRHISALCDTIKG